MGLIYCAACPCGFQKEDLFLGGGMRGPPEQTLWPAFCSECSDLVLIDLAHPEQPCPNCGAPAPLRYDDPALIGARHEKNSMTSFTWGDEELPSASFQCPKCREHRMKFFMAGAWD